MLYELDDIYLWGNNDNHRMLRSKEEFGRLQDSLTDKQLNVSRAYGCLRKMIETGLVKKVTKEEKLREVFRGLGDSVVLVDGDRLLDDISAMIER